MLALLKPVRLMMSGTVAPSARRFCISLTLSGSRRGLRPNFTPRSLALAMPSISLSPDVILELGNQGKDAHDEFAGAGCGVDRGIIQHLEIDALLGELGH